MNSGIMADCAGSWNIAPQSPFAGSMRAAVRRFARSSRGGAVLELALGAVVLTTTAAVCFDIYSRVTADTALGRMAVTMADYVSLEAAPQNDELRTLGAFLLDHELGVPADLAFVITAIHAAPSGDPSNPTLQVLWKHGQDEPVGLRFGNVSETAALADACANYVDAGNNATLPQGFEMLENEVVIIVEACARPTVQGSLTSMFVGSDMYRVHALPFRESNQIPAAPV